LPEIQNGKYLEFSQAVMIRVGIRFQIFYLVMFFEEFLAVQQRKAMLPAVDKVAVMTLFVIYLLTPMGILVLWHHRCPVHKRSR
jgi:fatty-acid desaturase